METREVLEHVQRIEEIGRKEEAIFGRHAAVLVSVMAAFLAIATLAGNRSSDESVLAQARASDIYNEYQANSLKRHINLDDAAQLRLTTQGTSLESAAAVQATALEHDVATKYQPAQDSLLPEAQALESERDSATAHAHAFEAAEAVFQLAIVLTSISIVARNTNLMVGGAILGWGGVVLFLNGFLLWLPLG